MVILLRSFCFVLLLFLVSSCATAPDDSYRIRKSVAGTMLTGGGAPESRDRALEQIREENRKALEDEKSAFTRDR